MLCCCVDSLKSLLCQSRYCGVSCNFSTLSSLWGLPQTSYEQDPGYPFGHTASARRSASVRPFPHTVTRYSHSRTHAKHGFQTRDIARGKASYLTLEASYGSPVGTSCMLCQFIFCRRFFPGSSNGERRKLSKILPSFH